MTRKWARAAAVFLVVITPAALAIAQDAPTARTTAVSLNLRAGPGEDHAIIGKLPYGTTVVIEARDVLRIWVLARAGDGRRGWASAYYMDFAEGVQLEPVPISGEVIGAAAPPPEVEPSAPPPVMAVSENVRQIYLRGLALGNNPHAFSRAGDCNSRLPFFLASFDYGDYDLGDYAYLQPAINHFAGSFARQGQAVFGSSSAWAALDSTWANPAYCNTGESPIACEFRLNRPGIVFVSFGTHDDPARFAGDLRAIIDYAIARGVIPILVTKADWYNNENNAIMASVAAEYGLPLVDFGAAAQALPNHGVREDGARLSYYFPLDFNNPLAMETGHALRNLMALQALDAVWRGAMQ
ncbi:MAG: SH3 domain-containing protein [Anaerolineae bacterium]|nr:SH3 domain-containing protein [Anaerolineae bacterium]